MATVVSPGGLGLVVIAIPLWLPHEERLGAGLEPASGRSRVPPRSTAELPQRVLRAGLEPASSRMTVPAALPLSYLSKVRNCRAGVRPGEGAGPASRAPRDRVVGWARTSVQPDPSAGRSTAELPRPGRYPFSD